MLRQLFSHFRSDLSVDLGTSNTVVCVPEDGVVVDEPSLVAVDEATRSVLSGGAAVGHLARQIQGRTPDSIRVVEPVSYGVVADFELCQSMLRYFFFKAQRSSLRLRPRVLATVPGSVTPVERRALVDSLERAGARDVRLVSTVKAAAIGAELPIHEPVASMVCDIGGGKTEVAILSLDEVVASRSIRVGGRGMDQAVVDYLRQRHSLRVGLATAERLRIEIGSACPLEEERNEEVRGIDVVSGLPRRAVLTSEEVRHALADPLDAILDAVRQTIEQCPPELAADLVDNGLVLSGGAAQLTGLDRLVREATGLPARVCEEPRLNVARGAQRLLDDLRYWAPLLEQGV